MAPEDRWDAPSAAEAARDEAEAQCAANGHVIGEDEDGEVVCDRCGVRALDDVEEPPSHEDEPEPDEDTMLAWAQQDMDRARSQPCEHGLVFVNDGCDRGAA